MRGKRLYLLAAVLLMASATMLMAHGDEHEAVEQTLKSYAAAIASKDIAKVEQYVLTDESFTVFEGGHVNNGWADYRDHHLAPELKEFESIRYEYRDIKAEVDAKLAFATFRYRIAVTMKERNIQAEGLGTAILVNTPSGWKIRHLHTSRSPHRKPKS